MDIFSPSTWTDAQRAAVTTAVTGIAHLLTTAINEAGNAYKIEGMEYNPTLGRYVPTSGPLSQSQMLQAPWKKS